MTQKKGTSKKTAELQDIFLELNEKGQETALTILKSLAFAQSVMCGEKMRKTETENGNGS